MIEYTLRPVEEADFDGILEVYRGCEDFLALGPVATASAEMVRADLDHSRASGGIFRGIFGTDGRMMGIVDVIPAGYKGDPQLASLELLMIAAPFRACGLGVRVVAQVEAELSASGVHTILSGVQVNNPNAIRFWTGRGYRIISDAIPMPDQTVAYQLKKDL